MKKIEFIGTSLKDLKRFPKDVKIDAGQELRLVQKGENPTDWKPMKSIGPGVKEIRINEKQGIYRIIYVFKYLDRVNVLHAFQKKTDKTSKKDLDLAKKRLNEVIGESKNGN